MPQDLKQRRVTLLQVHTSENSLKFLSQVFKCFLLHRRSRIDKDNKRTIFSPVALS